MAQKTLTGRVSSDKRDKTITVVTTVRETHPIYRKQYTVTRKYTAHDPNNEAGEGDMVVIGEVRPISKTKAHQLVEIVEKSKGSIELKQDTDQLLADKVDQSAKPEPATKEAA